MDYTIRKPNHLQEYDYATPGAYFITICTKDRKKILSAIQPVGADVLDRPRVALLPHGEIVERYIQQLDAFYPHIHVETYVIMPNHVHLLLRVSREGRPRTSAPTSAHSPIAQFVSTLKRFCNKEYGENIFQRSYYDHIIRGEQDYGDVWQYIDQNPVRWPEDTFYTP